MTGYRVRDCLVCGRLYDVGGYSEHRLNTEHTQALAERRANTRRATRASGLDSPGAAGSEPRRYHVTINLMRPDGSTR